MDESSALLYVGGYIVRALWKNIEYSQHKVLALYSFLEDSEIGDQATGDHDIESPDRVTLVNRGGLCRTEFIHEMAMKAGFNPLAPIVPKR